MSEISTHKNERISEYLLIFHAILEKEQAAEVIKSKKDAIDRLQPTDVIELVHQLVKEKLPTADIKSGIVKFLTLVSKQIKDYPYTPPTEGSYLDCLLQNGEAMENHLYAIRSLLKGFLQNPQDAYQKKELRIIFRDLEAFTSYYTIKENVLFPLLEKTWPNFGCLQIMWSFQDDVRKNLKDIQLLLSFPEVDIKLFNQLLGAVFFNMLGVKLRDERILFPAIQASIEEETLNQLFAESIEIGFPYYQPKITKKISAKENKSLPEGNINLGTGSLSVEQMILLFNHLPVDITFVDENNKVCFFSNPPKRIFPRTVAIIGREVHNCHPPESVHVVEQIVDAFRSGKKNDASFWIRMKGQVILIQYFALRNAEGKYKGVIEVSQEITEIQSLEGERRILDWET